MNHSRQQGFTLLELVVAVSILLSMLVSVIGAVQTANTTTLVNDRSAEVADAARRSLHRISSFVRPAKLSTMLARAVAEDVAAGRAARAGDWIFPTDLVWRPGIQFQAATGLLSMNAALSTAPRVLSFELDAREVANGADDDRDGLVDEGVVRLIHDNVTITMVRDVEECSFWLDSRMLTVRLRCARCDPQRRVYRTEVRQTFYLRNN